MYKVLKRAFILAVLAVVVALSAVLSACTLKTKHPRARIEIEFNDETYTIEYTLYRNMYPKTVQHFIDLADSGFYKDMIVHDYQSSDWFTGGYRYSEDGGESAQTSYSAAYGKSANIEYLEANSKEAEYMNFFNNGGFSEYTVFSQMTYDKNNKETVLNENALPTLIGEFTNNDHNIEKGALEATFGVLKMYYYDKGDAQKVAIRNWDKQIVEHDYKYNCATSLFAIQKGETSNYGAANYCVFAQLRNDKSRNRLEDLFEAVSDYISDYKSGSESSFYKTAADVHVDTLDTFADADSRDITVDFRIPEKPIIIRSVKITKY